MSAGFPGRLLFIGFGSIAQGLLPLVWRHFGLAPGQVMIISADAGGQAVAAAYGVGWLQATVDRDNYRELLGRYVRPGDVVLNLAVEVSSLDVLTWCQEHGALYLDTGIEPWQGGYADADPLRTTNYWLREQALARRRPGLPTAVLAHGANPGLVNHLLKRALLDLAELRGVPWRAGDSSWGALAERLDIRVIHIAERDTQTDDVPCRPGEFACTWSVDGLLAESAQPAEMGWGSHEGALLPGMRQPDFGCGASIYWPHGGPDGASAVRLPRLKSWVPSVGEQVTWLITHNESISIADFLTVCVGGAVRYRPTVAYAYRPCPKTCASLTEWEARGLALPTIKRVMAPQTITGGQDELGVLLCFPGGAYWYGSTLGIAEARRLAPHNNATSLQVAAGMLGGLAWAIDHPRAGVVEADHMDFAAVLAVAAPYLGRLGGAATDWRPSSGRGLGFEEFLVMD